MDQLTRIEEKLVKPMTDLNSKLEQIKEDISEIKVSQAEMKRDIAHHIKRTDLAEKNLEMLRDEIKPIKRHVAMLEGGLKLVGIVVLIAGLAMTLVNLYKAV